MSQQGNSGVPPPGNWEEVADQDTLAQKTSKMSLNVNAPEFVPSWQMPAAPAPSAPTQHATDSTVQAPVATSSPVPPPNITASGSKVLVIGSSTDAKDPETDKPAGKQAEKQAAVTPKRTQGQIVKKEAQSPSDPSAQVAEALEEHVVDSATLQELYGKEHLNIVFIGHVDAGKSTMGGNILFLTGMVDQRTLEKYEKEAKDVGRESWYLSWALDTNKEERAKGKTVECGRAYFETEKRRYTILDAPGHKNYVPSMIGGASQADIGILVISARRGEFETGFERGGQTREHALLAKTSGVNRLVVAINKMDDPTVEWSKDRYDECVNKITPFLKHTGYNPSTDIYFMPVSGFNGANLKERVTKDVCPWHSGPSLLEYLDNLQAVERKIDAPLMLPVTEKYKDMGTIVVGKIESGKINRGQSALLMPNKVKVEVSTIYNELEDEINVGICGDNVRLRLRGVEEEDVSPGFVLCSLKQSVKTTNTFEAQVIILEHKNIICAGYQAVLHVHTCVEDVSISALLHLIDKKTNRRSKRPPQFVKKGQKVIARLETAGPICVEAFEDYQQLGRFTLRDEGKTIAIGKVTKVLESE